MTSQDSKGRRTVPSITRMANKRLDTAELKDLSGKSVVTLQWGLNEASKRDQVFRIQVNGESALISLEEFLAYSRLM